MPDTTTIGTFDATRQQARTLYKAARELAQFTCDPATRIHLMEAAGAAFSVELHLNKAADFFAAMGFHDHGNSYVASQACSAAMGGTPGGDQGTPSGREESDESRAERKAVPCLRQMDFVADHSMFGKVVGDGGKADMSDVSDGGAL